MCESQTEKEPDGNSLLYCVNKLSYLSLQKEKVISKVSASIYAPTTGSNGKKMLIKIYVTKAILRSYFLTQGIVDF